MTFAVCQVTDLYDPREQWASYMINAIKAKELYLKDVTYITRGNEAIIVDEFTGRTMPGRRYVACSCCWVCKSVSTNVDKLRLTSCGHMIAMWSSLIWLHVVNFVWSHAVKSCHACTRLSGGSKQYVVTTASLMLHITKRLEVAVLKHVTGSSMQSRAFICCSSKGSAVSDTATLC